MASATRGEGHKGAASAGLNGTIILHLLKQLAFLGWWLSYCNRCILLLPICLFCICGLLHAQFCILWLTVACSCMVTPMPHPINKQSVCRGQPSGNSIRFHAATLRIVMQDHCLTLPLICATIRPNIILPKHRENLRPRHC